MSFVASFKRMAGLLATLALLANPTVSFPQDDGQQHGFRHDEGQHDDHDLDTLSLKEKIELLRRKVKYVIVIFHENESFDHYFGTFPGANGLFSAPRGATPARATPSFSQQYLDTSLKPATISPFLMPQAVKTAAGQIVPIYPADEISVDHSHQGMSNSLNVDPTTGVAANDRFAMDQEGLTTDSHGNLVTNGRAGDRDLACAKAESRGGYWPHRLRHDPLHGHWAKNFVLFDNFHQTIVGPSTPNAIALIAGQSGQTQWARHNDQGPTVTYANSAFQNPLGASYGSQIMPTTSNAYVPVVGDPGPFPGSNLDTNAVKPPYIITSTRIQPARL
ncbi:alkaline phosphatase family protein [Paraburkholderia sp. BR10954]|uniref:alkaline phosphatase family protein n=1 Tax=Paraburkholderia sp. BR10954 TaxID=3236995 RepID=UPI0034D2F280